MVSKSRINRSMSILVRGRGVLRRPSSVGGNEFCKAPVLAVDHGARVEAATTVDEDSMRW